MAAPATYAPPPARLQETGRPAPARRRDPARRLSLPGLVAGCLLLAAASMALPFAPAYDPWAWVVWGREALQFELDTTGGPSWKPFPVLFTTPFALLGDAAPWLWTVVARAGWVLSLCLVYRLAGRLCGTDARPWRIAAGAIACCLFVLSPGDESRSVRYLAQANVEPLLAALLLGAAERHLDGRRDHAFGLLTFAALIRPEVWPFLALYAVLVWQGDPRRRPFVVVSLAAVPLLWFGADWAGSGSPMTGGDRARVGHGGASEALAALGAALGAVAPLVWIAAAGAVARARRPERSIVGALALAAAAWVAIVVVMAGAFGFAGIARFVVPAAAALAVLGAAGIVMALRAAPAGRRRAFVAACLSIGAILSLVPRVAALPEQERVLSARAESQRELRMLVSDLGGPAGAFRCGTLAVDQAGIALESKVMLAWELDVPLRAISHRLLGRPGVVLTRVGARRHRRLLARPRGVALLDREGGWVALAVRCGAAA